MRSNEIKSIKSNQTTSDDKKWLSTKTFNSYQMLLFRSSEKEASYERVHPFCSFGTFVINPFRPHFKFIKGTAPQKFYYGVQVLGVILYWSACQGPPAFYKEESKALQYTKEWKCIQKAKQSYFGNSRKRQINNVERLNPVLCTRGPLAPC